INTAYPLPLDAAYRSSGTESDPKENTFSCSDNEDANEHIEKVLEIVDLFHILDSRGAIPTKTAEDAKKAIQEMAEYSQKWHNEHLEEEDEDIEQQLQDSIKGTTQILRTKNEGNSVSVIPLSTYLNLGLGELAHIRLTVELADRTMKYPKGIAKNVLVGIGKFTFPVDFVILDMPEDFKVPLILGRPFLSTTQAKIDDYKKKITLRAYGRDFGVNRSLDPLFEDYIELNDLNEPIELRRNQGDDLIPNIKEGEVIEEFRTRNEDLDSGIDDYPSYYNSDKNIHIDCAHNLKFSCMIGFEFIHINFFPLLYVNVMTKKFHNSIMKDKMVYKGNNVVGALMNVTIFVGNFYVVTDFAVLENMDAYRDEGMDDVIFGEPFLREIGIKARRFDGMITL
ncbi:reverse transcriptase domain-containing protein, partial [Tanacetum coccineum]